MGEWFSNVRRKYEVINMMFYNLFVFFIFSEQDVDIGDITNLWQIFRFCTFFLTFIPYGDGQKLGIHQWKR